ncbi:MAG: hypothetical protein GXO21_07935, partial [Aquificae bacterium]|nr:hypothetical protein [Aquificota bacterium]
MWYMRKVINLFFRNFWYGAGQISSVIGIAIAFAFWIWKPDLKIAIPLSILFLLIIFSLLLALAGVKTIYDLYKKCYEFSNYIIGFVETSLDDGLGIITTKKYPWIEN